jgi:hypothetical protein
MLAASHETDDFQAIAWLQGPLGMLSPRDELLIHFDGDGLWRNVQAREKIGHGDAGLKLLLFTVDDDDVHLRWIKNSTVM